MNLIINKHVIDASIDVILKEIRRLTNNYYFKDIGTENNNNIRVTCPFHKDGQETHPSCAVYISRDDPELEYGYYKCFTCGEKGPLWKLVGHCLNLQEFQSKEWLVDNFSNTFVEYQAILPEIKLNEPKKEYLDESILKQYAYYHPYLEDRGISFETAKKFQVGWNQEHNSITFPVWDRYGRLVGITERSIDYKKFHVPHELKKPLYLLDYIIVNNITSVFVCESQMNCLTLWEWGYPAIAMFGTGSKDQYEILKTSGIRHYYLCFDGDDAGRKGANKFRNNMPSSVLITTLTIPEGKDVNDLTKEEFEEILKRG